MGRWQIQDLCQHAEDDKSSARDGGIVEALNLLQAVSLDQLVRETLHAVLDIPVVEVANSVERCFESAALDLSPCLLPRLVPVSQDSNQRLGV
jgi:hypothetical protein